VTRSRRVLLVSFALTLAAACARVGQRAQPPAFGEPQAEFKRWENEAKAILSDGLETLRTFEVYAAFRVSLAPSSERRAATDLVWDAPSNAAWNEATHVARGLHGRAEQLFLGVSTAQVDAALWRQQRDMADGANLLVDLGDALRAYRERLDHLDAASDGTAVWELLDRVWAQWDASATRWRVSRTELVAC
jgi:hypothetical protein